MSLHTTEPPTGQHPTEGPRNFKAEAKAAKAYAKAIRPWYKKKRVLIPAAFVILALAGTAASGSKSSSTSNTSGSTAGVSTSADHKSTADNTFGKVGQAVTNAGTTYKVTNANVTDQIGDPVLGERADGKFVIVDLSLTNNKNETKTFLESTAKLVTRDGKEYDTSDKAVMAFGDKSLLMKDIQPDLTTSGKLAFDVPPSKVSGSTLVIDDIWGSGQVKVHLGL